jgi:hypothetical protein
MQQTSFFLMLGWGFLVLLLSPNAGGIALVVTTQVLVMWRLRRMGLKNTQDGFEVRRFLFDRRVPNCDLVGYRFKYHRTNPSVSVLELVTVDRRALTVYGVSFFGESDPKVSVEGKEQEIRSTLSDWGIVDVGLPG